MQSLWARAGQAHHCASKTASTVANSVGRRATSTTRRRRATFAEVFTACYSSIFATAAMVDAIRKEDRRQELDRHLEETRHAVAELRTRNMRAIPEDSLDLIGSAPDPLTLDQMDDLWQALKMIYRDRPFMKEIHKPAFHSSCELTSHLKWLQYRCLSSKKIEKSISISYTNLERDILREETRDEARASFAYVNMQLNRESESIGHLVSQLLFRSRLMAKSERRTSLVHELEALMAQNYPRFTLQEGNLAEVGRNTRMLNQRLRALMETRDSEPGDVIAEICYNLIVSKYTPDIHTYNMLIAAFNKAGYHRLAEALVNSFFNGRIMKPSHCTFVAILNHYKCTKNHGKFLRALGCLTGVDGRGGGRIRRRSVEDVAKHPILREWAKDVRLRTQTDGWVCQHVPLTHRLIEVIIKGLLYFKMYDKAATFFITCMWSGVRLGKLSFQSIFEGCISALDWVAARRLLHGLNTCHEKWPTRLRELDVGTRGYVIDRIYVLLDMCSTLYSPRLDASGQPAAGGLDEASRIRMLASLDDLRRTLSERVKKPLEKQLHRLVTPGSASKSRLLKVQSIWREHVVVRQTIISIESKLLQPPLSYEFRISMAFHIATSSVPLALEDLHLEFASLMGIRTSASPTMQGILRSIQGLRYMAIEGAAAEDHAHVRKIDETLPDEDEAGFSTVVRHSETRLDEIGGDEMDMPVTGTWEAEEEEEEEEEGVPRYVGRSNSQSKLLSWSAPAWRHEPAMGS